MRLLSFTIAISAVALASAGSGDDAASNRNERILAAYSTRTIVSLSTTTVTSMYECLSKISATACNGRKMRRYKSLMDEEDLRSKAERDDRGLESSINDEDLLSDNFSA